jgi:hypothetical protein
MAQNSNSRNYLPILAVLVIAMAALGYFLTRPPKITGLEVALKTASFLDKNFPLNGDILGGYFCEKELPECKPVKLSTTQPHVGQAIFSYFMLAEASGIQSYRQTADRALDWVLDACETNVKMCEWNFFPLVQYYEKTGQDKYLKGMLRSAEGFLTMTNEDIVKNNVGHKLASLYNATGDARFRNRLFEVADEELRTPPLEGFIDTFIDIQVAWSIYVPLYRVSGQQQYLKAAEEVFDNFNVAENLDQFNSPELIPDAVKAGDVLLSLAELSKNGKEYKKQAHDLVQEIMLRLWDTPENLKFNGDYGFGDSLADDSHTYKPALLNGWLIKLFVLMKDEKFVVPTNK